MHIIIVVGSIVDVDFVFFQMNRHYQGARWIIAISKLTSCNWDCPVDLVYGGHTVANQTMIFNELSAIIQTLHYPLLLLGDFNQIVNINERKYQLYDLVRMMY